MTETAVTLVVHACPPLAVRAVADVIADYRLDDSTPPELGSVDLGAGYSRWSSSCGDAAEIHTRLAQRAPAAAWEVWEDPTCTAESCGAVYRHTPDLGDWDAQACSDDGAPMFWPGDIRAAITDCPAELDRLLGEPWRLAFEAMPPGVVEEPRRWPVTWERRHGRIVVDGAADDGTDLLLPTIPAQAPALEVVHAPADAALTAAGFVLAEPWHAADRHGRIHEAEVYRVTTADRLDALTPGRPR